MKYFRAQMKIFSYSTFSWEKVKSFGKTFISRNIQQGEFPRAMHAAYISW